MLSQSNLTRSVLYVSDSFSFFQNIWGDGSPEIRHSSRTGNPSVTPVFCSFSINTGALCTSLAVKIKIALMLTLVYENVAFQQHAKTR